MADPVRLLLTNAAAAGLIALVAWAASRVLRRHAVVHALWLLTLLKLVSPPVAPVPLLPSWTSEPLVLPSRTPTVAVIPAPLAAGARLRDRAATAGHATAERPRSPEAARLWTGSLRPPAEPRPANPPFGWRPAVWAGLASGALAIAGLAAWRFVRFRRLLAGARPAPRSLSGRASALASQLGLRRAPRVLLLRARIPPMLWPDPAGPLLLMPERLIADLGTDELDALLAHELAHVRRRDHWVRLVEIAATALFWWYPVTWWARRALRRAEERCCDEWVLRVLPRSARAYANGLLKSLAFVADAPVPALASGLGPVEDLEARLKEILMTRPAPQLAVPLRLALAVAAVLGLAAFPTHARPRAGCDDPAKPAAVVKKAPPAPAAPAAEEAPPAPDAPRATEDGVQGGLDQGVAGGVAGGVPGGIAGAVPVTPPAPPLTPRPALAPPARPVPPGVPPPTLAPHVGPVPVTPLPPRPARALAPALARAPMAPRGPIPPMAALAGPATPRSPEQRALDEQRRAIEHQRRQLHEQEIEVARKQLDLEASVAKAAVAAEAARLRADGRADEALRLEKRAQLGARRLELQKRELELEAERAALEAKLEVEMQTHEDRLEAAEKDGQEQAMGDAQRDMERAAAAREQSQQELEKEQEALQREMEDSEKQEEALAAEEEVHALCGASEELVRSIDEQIASLKQARGHAPAQRAEIEREIQRLQAALDALNAGATPGPQAPQTPRPPSKTPRP